MFSMSLRTCTVSFGVEVVLGSRVDGFVLMYSSASAHLFVALLPLIAGRTLEYPPLQ
jgi:hypothetical protein